MSLTALVLGAMAMQSARNYGIPQDFMEVDDSRLTELSGLGSSPFQDGVFYGHNDSGDTARFFRMSREGRITATFTLTGATAKDWEDMAVVNIAGRAWVYLADIGDNNRQRADVVIYRTREPEAGVASRNLTFETYRLKYPDGPRDAEAFLVDPRNGDFYIVSKAATGSSVYHLPAPARSGGYRLTKLGDLPIATGGLGGNLVTAADWSHDGKYVVVRTYSGAREYPVPANRRDWFKQPHVTVELPVEKQGEAICYNRSSNALISGSEGRPALFAIIPLEP